MKPNKENIINDILIELEKGKTYKETSLVILGKYKFSEPTYAKYWKIANERYAERQELIKKELEKESVNAARERLKKAIITREEGLAFLSNTAKILFSNVVQKKDEPDTLMINSLNNVIANIAKLEGWNAPEKNETTLKGSISPSQWLKDMIDE